MIKDRTATLADCGKGTEAERSGLMNLQLISQPGLSVDDQQLERVDIVREIAPIAQATVHR